MNRRRFLAQAALAATATPLLFGAGPQRRKPNVLFIVGDDIGYGDLGCFGSRKIRTPNLDRMAAEGLRLTDFHANAAVCTPTRAAFLTGRYPHRSGLTEVLYENKIEDAGKGLDPRREVSLARAFKDGGYATGLMGKWHLGERPEVGPLRHGFDEFRGYKSGNIDYVNHLDSAGHPDWWNGEKLDPEEGYVTTLLTKHGVDFIKRHQSHPFLLVLTHECVHGPLQAPGDPALRAPGEKMKRVKTTEETYFKMMEEMDRGIGELFKALDETGQSGNTFVFFFSDNGAHADGAGSNAPWRGSKSQLYEGGHRTPAIAWFPKRIAPGVCAETLMGMDLMPTALALAGIAPPASLRFDGVDLGPVFFGGGKLAPRSLCWNSLGYAASRRGDWKLVVKNREKIAELFDLRKDPAESVNLAESQPQILRELQEGIAAWRADVTKDAVKQPLTWP